MYDYVNYMRRTSKFCSTAFIDDVVFSIVVAVIAVVVAVFVCLVWNI